MDFEIGDRVRSLIDDGSGLYYGEYGTVIEVERHGIPIVRWDEFNQTRHTADERVEYGHGWFVFKRDAVELVEEAEDFGDLPEANTDAKDILFGL